ncbi:calcyclin binding protein, putative [Plasmodium knowlesi strain H]|uniref:Calcyclin binding protein, putative n=3 Tax=Plasmodium knowlesi TaxID=5850 RepID=A0A5K1U1P8_PLAKH|nr:calcyclin-binding protein, putative [Plasmodium knowlesi strain H]OTN67388.1 putative Calcyclin binding protein [Plasmodium knowlesi]CAA9987610.1 calcyclin-binding protein, putative [Plasmodium knowlesi strain H]SBO26991.1 calcyclin binding protein, putative [Plasmodium knowlesi strain H]SBO29247.1 calcyclin binding protein, putative [Plasmodium knowlesi strain H]VVS77084.1 calcyclin-binding protein, putative [Plasmodium knowlesi strain H]|eukprot:XP_002258611.1 SGT1-like protein, putative [Plasmodium knowlesi strain H]
MDSSSLPHMDHHANIQYEQLEKLKKTKVLLNEKLIRHDWSQTTDRLFLTLYKKGLHESDCLYYVDDGHLSLIIKMDGDEIYLLEKRLFSKIIPRRTSVSVTPMKVEVTLEKLQPGVEWPQLEKLEESEKDKANGLAQNKENLLNPFSGKSTHEWDKLTKSIKEDEDEGNIDTFFRKIYNEGDDDTKRAMIKSFQTSRGTVLSTNWKDVQHKNYEQDKPVPDDKEIV